MGLAGHDASFEVSLGSTPDTVVWLKDNKPMSELLADRANVTHTDNRNFRMELKNCVESDSGTYTALAANKSGNSTCTAQLLVHECKNAHKYLISVLFYTKLICYFYSNCGRKERQ